MSRAFGVPAVSTGDIFRANVKNETPLGLQAKSFMDAGNNVPDSLTNDLITDRLADDDCARGFLLDGYPRTTDQVRHLDDFLATHDSALNVVVQLLAEPDVVVERLRKRALEQGRTDDDEAVVRHRLEVYSNQTAPLIDVYTDRGLVVAIDGIGEIADVTGRIMSALEGRGIRP
jgi:adenylate kinase